MEALAEIISDFFNSIDPNPTSSIEWTLPALGHKLAAQVALRDTKTPGRQRCFSGDC